MRVRGAPRSPEHLAAPRGAAPPARARRDRRGRGMRGPLAPPDSRLHRTRAQAFNDLVLDAAERLDQRWQRELAGVEFAVDAVPGPTESGTAEDGRGGVALSRLHRGRAGRNARIVLYRRAIEARAANRADLAALVQDLVVEQVAELLGIPPERVDPGYGLT